METSQSGGAGVLEQGPIAPLVEPTGSVRPVWSQSGPLYVPALSSAWSVSSLSQADQDPKNSQESAAITSSMSMAIGPCDFTLPDLDPVLVQRYGPQVKEPLSMPVIFGSKGLPTPTGLELFNSTPSLQDSLYIQSHLSVSPALDISGIQPTPPLDSEIRLSASLFNLENLLASILKLLEKFVGAQTVFLTL
ncbi:hypothetical protein NDU88_002703 [Pleurodeles waltl]|uniref:Uncharacterized protein n=1 Tax=Pleurodeles waltl TaxID=8319 RepID=A0AAV7RC68_PLEWA|nr:hypothetical protein NDU88_002703 [Pleurodeles waltl]